MYKVLGRVFQLRPMIHSLDIYIHTIMDPIVFCQVSLNIAQMQQIPLWLVVTGYIK